MYPGGGDDPDRAQPEYPPPQDPFLTGAQPPVPFSPPPPGPQYQPPPVAQPSPPFAQPPVAQPPFAQSPFVQPSPAGQPQPSFAQPSPAGQPPQPSPSWWTSQGILLLAVAVVAIFSIVAVVGVATWVITRPDKPVGSAPVAPTSAAPQHVADPVTGLVLGSGPVWVDVYVDYQCPPCSNLEESTGPVLTEYLASNRVTLSIHPVAFIDDRSKNQYSTRAAAAMACAYEAGKGAEFHRYLLEHQPPEDTAGPTDSELIQAGTALGASGSFGACVSTHQKLDWVERSTTEANDDDVDSVPAVFVNDRDVQATRAAVVAAIDSAK